MPDRLLWTYSLSLTAPPVSRWVGVDCLDDLCIDSEKRATDRRSDQRLSKAVGIAAGFGTSKQVSLGR
ncbi:MAG: hypothetical protein IT422_23315 [Pirellulaceae bacterium]|nr:hypothetical protein [Pirellulaceae bacterium]